MLADRRDEESEREIGGGERGGTGGGEKGKGEQASQIVDALYLPINSELPS